MFASWLKKKPNAFKIEGKYETWLVGNCVWVMQICSYLHSLWGLLVFMRLLQIVQTSFLRAFFHACTFFF